MTKTEPAQTDEQTPPLMSEAFEQHTEPLAQEAPVEQLASLEGVPEGLKTAIQEERRKRSREGAENLRTIVGQREALERAKIDPVTGLRNSVAFAEEFPSIFSRMHSGELTMYYVDLNGLNRANNRFDHETGNKYLAATANALSESLRPTDLIYRIGGDEIVVLLDGKKTEEDAYSIQERVKAKAATAIAGLGLPEDAYLGISMGAAVKWDGETADEFKARADAELKQDKEAFYADIEAKTGQNLRR